jgi:hypothetical protein
MVDSDYDICVNKHKDNELDTLKQTRDLMDYHIRKESHHRMICLKVIRRGVDICLDRTLARQSLQLSIQLELTILRETNEYHLKRVEELSLKSERKQEGSPKLWQSY